jgi:hypothetical protein
MAAKVEVGRLREGMASCEEGKEREGEEEFVRCYRGRKLENMSCLFAVSDQSPKCDAVARRHCDMLGGKWERGSDFQLRAGGKAQRACRSEKGIEVLTGQWGYGCPGQ